MVSTLAFLNTLPSRVCSLAAVCAPTGLPVQVSLEIVMGCGTGVCYGCTIRTTGGLKQVCKDGPVFDLQAVDLDSLGAPR